MCAEALLEAIEAYTKAVQKREIACRMPTCPKCGEDPGVFKYHDQRRRSYYVVVEWMVRKVASLLTRWKCTLCGSTFTLYPEFALPHKRYVQGTILQMSGSYVDGDRISYRQIVRPNHRAIFHAGQAGDPEEAIDDRVLSHSTLHRWIQFLGGLTETLRRAWQMIRAKSATSEVFRNIFPVAPWKCRSHERNTLLQVCRSLLDVEDEYQSLFGISIFPHFATLCCWR